MATSKSVSLFWFLLLSILTNVVLARARAFFVFGDSLVDNGNNNFLATSARADNVPYGVDYPTRQPTGRFSNGLNIPDLISEAIGSEATLPYLSPMLTGQKLLVGANFASAGVGILNDTGAQFANIIRMPRQMEYLEEYKERVSEIIGQEEAERLVSQSLTLVTLGGNDFVNNYYLVPFSARSRQFDLPDYVPYVISEYRTILMRLYEIGLRRILVTGTGPIGCVPAELAQHSRNGECVEEFQRAAMLFNPQLQQMLDSLNQEVGTHAFIGVNIRQSSIDFISDPATYGFATSKIACCGQGPYNGIGLCTPRSNLCSNRDIYAFWDPFHPTERANRFVVKNIIMGSKEYISPMNLSTIMELDAAANV